MFGDQVVGGVGTSEHGVDLTDDLGQLDHPDARQRVERSLVVTARSARRTEADGTGPDGATSGCHRHFATPTACRHQVRNRS